MNTVLDVCEVALSCVYAAWLDKHKALEPKMTWLEVVFGVAYTLAISTLRGRCYGGDWWDQMKRVGRDFALSSTPIIVTEVRQALEAHHVDAVWEEEHLT